jgi:DNA helicase-2/ATP-dependent DNA helicase PcrA
MPIPYTATQREAVFAPDRNLQVIAAAGSGKTQVMAARVAELLSREGITPASIVAFTFTEKAAAELKDRIHQVVREQHGDVPGMAEMFVGTMHGYSLAAIQTHLYRFLKFSVLNDVQTRLFVNRYSNQCGMTSVPIIAGPAIGSLLTRKDTKLFVELMGMLREDDIRRSAVSLELRRALDTYLELLREHRYFDYSGILAEAVAALSGDDRADEPLREFVRTTVRHVIVDEYQDLNPLQERLVRSMHSLGAIVSVVGDDDQTIYQWRGSDISGILTFSERYEDVLTVTLDDNFRSSPGVVEVGRLIAEGNDPARLKKHMVASGHQQFERGDIVAVEFHDPEAEAAWIVERMRRLRGAPFFDKPGATPRGLSWSDFAVLLRSVSKSAEPIVDALKAADIPYVVGGIKNLFDAPEVVAAVSLFEYIVDDCSADDVVTAWADARVGVDQAVVRTAVGVLDGAKDFRRGDRWGSYNIQRTFLNFLEAIDLREEDVQLAADGSPRGELILYNLGKFSQLISDFEQINFHSEPASKYESFKWFLRRDAIASYEEGGAESGYAKPDAVQIMTVHRSKGLQWPVVFVPALQANRFPGKKHGGRTRWHVIPREAISNPDRYDGGEPDERRLFYVAATRSQKFLHFSFAPGASKLYQRASSFFTEVTSMPPVLTRPVDRKGDRLVPTPLVAAPEITLSFSELKYLFECPYQFKLRFLYGFNPPLHEALGFGKSLHDCMAEIHRRAMAGENVPASSAEALVDEHLHVPFAYPKLREDLRRAAIKSVRRYLSDNGDQLARTEHVEKAVEVAVGPGLTVNGRIDLIRRLDTDEVAIVDFKSTERAQDEDVTRQQLHIYAMGYRELTGQSADLIEVLNLDAKGKSTREVVDDALLGETTALITGAGDAVRANSLPKLTKWCDSCARCDLVGICRDRTDEVKPARRRILRRG